jgi:hypothetical protein
MTGCPATPQLLRVLHGEGLGVRTTPYGSVGTILDSGNTEVVWVCKDDEDIDPDWFCQDDTDVLCVVQGQLRVEFARGPDPAVTVGPGEVLVLPPRTACRAYRWPRDCEQATVFLAITARRAGAAQNAR